jgi:hypothetical protein
LDFVTCTPFPTFARLKHRKCAIWWRRYADPDVRRLLLEIQHPRGVLNEVESLRVSVDRVWKEEVGGQLVTLYHLRCLLQREQKRTVKIRTYA